MSECGSCTMCCKLLRVEELDKPINTWCTNVSQGKGCGIYNDRPQSCRNYSCLWLVSQNWPKPLPEALRPDKCKVVFDAGGKAGTEERWMIVRVEPSRSKAWETGLPSKVISNFMDRNSKGRVIVSCGSQKFEVSRASV